MPMRAQRITHQGRLLTVFGAHVDNRDVGSPAALRTRLPAMRSAGLKFVTIGATPGNVQIDQAPLHGDEGRFRTHQPPQTENHNAHADGAKETVQAGLVRNSQFGGGSVDGDTVWHLMEPHLPRRLTTARPHR